MLDPLSPASLRTRFDADAFDFETTDDLDADTQIVGQDRAVEALELGIEMDATGYNVFALGPSGTGRRDLVQHLLDDQAAGEDTPPDWCYVNNFEDEREPTALQIEAGRGMELKEDVEQLIEDLKTALPAAFESEEYQARREMVQEEVREDQEEALEELQDRAREDDIALIRTPQGFAFAPIRDGEVLSPEAVESMDEEKREAIQQNIEAYQDELQQILRKVPQSQREARKRIEELNREMAHYAVGDSIDEVKAKYDGNEEVVAFLESIHEDVIDNVDVFVNASQTAQNGNQSNPLAQMMQQSQ